VEISPKAAAVAYAVCFDGYKGLFPQCGQLAADPQQQVTMIFGILFGCDTYKIREFLREVGNIYGFNADGTVINAPKQLDIHEYSRLPNGNGCSLDDSTQFASFRAMNEILAEMTGSRTAPVMTEWGYSRNAANPISWVPAGMGLSSPELISAYAASTMLWFTRFGFKAAWIYDDYPHTPQPWTADTLWDLTCGNVDTETQWVIKQIRQVAAGAVLRDYNNPDGLKTVANWNRFTLPSGKTLIAAWGNQPGMAVQIPLEGQTTLVRHTLNGSDVGTTPTTRSASGASYADTVGPKPVFYLLG
jgi:hypothetical protein